MNIYLILYAKDHLFLWLLLRCEDVYKRQYEKSGKSLVYFGEGNTLLAVIAISDKIKDTSRPVSYTHLDVYKRQSPWYIRIEWLKPDSYRGLMPELISCCGVPVRYFPDKRG